jgi:hypothetical protein
MEVRVGTIAELVLGNTKVDLEWIGEGCEGDYDRRDPGDAPLARFNVMRRVIGDDSHDVWEQVDDASYCTRLRVDTLKPDEAIAAITDIMKAVRDGVESGRSIKRICERLSWMASPSQLEAA